MQLTVRDVSRLMKVPEKTVYRWVKSEGLPAVEINEQYHFNRAELLEWATSRNFDVPADLFQSPQTESFALPDFVEALSAGGIFYRIPGADKESILRSVVGVMILPPHVDRVLMLNMLLAREALETTAVGEGVAIPHPRNPIVLRVRQPQITLCFLEKPVDFGALDGRPVHALFILVSPTPKIHLHLLSRLSYCLHQPEFKEVIAGQAEAGTILDKARRLVSAASAARPAS